MAATRGTRLDYVLLVDIKMDILKPSKGQFLRVSFPRECWNTAVCSVQSPNRLIPDFKMFKLLLYGMLEWSS